MALWGRKIEGLDPKGAIIGGRTIRSRWIVGADGFHSRVRQWAGLAPPAWNGVRRIGLRQHYRVRPWTDFVEVYWRKDCQAYVTPVGANEVCVAMVSTKESRASDLADMFPALASHLGGAELVGPARGGFRCPLGCDRLSAVASLWWVMRLVQSMLLPAKDLAGVSTGKLPCNGSRRRRPQEIRHKPSPDGTNAAANCANSAAPGRQ